VNRPQSYPFKHTYTHTPKTHMPRVFITVEMPKCDDKMSD